LSRPSLGRLGLGRDEAGVTHNFLRCRFVTQISLELAVVRQILDVRKFRSVSLSMRKNRETHHSKGSSGSAEVGTESSMQHQNLAQNQHQLRPGNRSRVGRKFYKSLLAHGGSLRTHLHALSIGALIMVRAIL
jgi:hypothetical protein